ncbi:MAG: hypothetical protein ABIJ83_00910 [Patescibacteria group bacterium]
MEKICPVCNKFFETVSSTRKYCGGDCRNKFQKELNDKKIKLCVRCGIKKTPFPSVKYCKECNKIVFQEQKDKHRKLTRKNSLKRHYFLRDESEYKKKMAEQTKKCIRRRYKKDKNFKIGMRLRNLLNYALKSYTEKGKTFSSRKYGINYNKIIEHLMPFPENIGNWHIDHIKPLSSFNLEDIEEVKKAFAPENHQWLLASENISKGNKLNWKSKNELIIQKMEIEMPKLTEDKLQRILGDCLTKILEKHKFKFRYIEKGEDKKNKCGAFLIRTESFEGKDWFIFLRKKKVSLEEGVLRGILFHELGHYFYRKENPQNQSKKNNLDNEVDEFVKDKWGVEEEIKSMRKIDLALYLSTPYKILFAECCEAIDPKWCFE